MNIAFSQSVLQLHGMSVSRADSLLCENISLQVDAGQIWHIQGANGLGKTTFLMILAGLLPSQKPQLQWANTPPEDWPTLYFGHRLGLNLKLSVLENLQFLAQLQSLSTKFLSIEQFYTALDIVGLAGYEDIAVAKLSSGQKRRVGLARLWLCDLPLLWLLDEPFTALDVRMIDALNQRLQQHADNGGRIILTSHQPVASANKILDLSQYRVQAIDAMYATNDIGMSE